MLAKDDDSFFNQSESCEEDVSFGTLTSQEKQSLFIQKFINDRSNQKVLYIHTPYCPNKCRYCNYHSKNLTSSDQLDYFINLILPSQISEYREILSNVSFDQVYFGGGTPTLVNSELLVKIFESIPNFRQIPKKCIETSPITLTTEHVKLFKEYELNFISVGVQSLNKRICNKWNRPYINTDELKRIVACLNSHELYFNIDLICFMDKGDVRDLLGFHRELTFIIKKCKPSSITIHQLSQSYFSSDKTLALIKLLREVLEQNSDYICANSMLRDGDSLTDSAYEAEYRLIKRNDTFTHYMWSKYSGLPIEGYDMLSLGYIENVQTASNVGNLLYIPNEATLTIIHYDEFISRDYRSIRKNKGLPI